MMRQDGISKAKRWTPLAANLHWLPLLALGVGSALIYAGALNFGLFNDDPTGNFAWMDSRTLLGLFSSPSGYGFYRPAGFAVWKLLRLAFGPDNVVVLHLVSILLHGLNAVAVWLVFHRMTGRTVEAWIAGVLFACAPLSYEAVAYVAALFHPLLTFLALTSLLTFDRFRSTGRTVYFAASLACLVAALFTHENGVILPGLLIVWELLASKTAVRPLARAILLLAGCIATGLFVLLWASMQTNLAGRIITAAEMQANALPFLQAVASPLLPYARLSDQRPIILVALVAAIILLSIASAVFTRTKRTLLFALLWLLATALPAVVFLPHEYLIGGPRLYYLFWVGVALLWGLPFAAAARLIGRRIPAALFGAALLLAFIIPPLSFVRCEMRLYSDATRMVRQVARLAGAAPSGQTPVFANLPVYFKESPASPRGCSVAYPWVHNGAIVFPTYVRLGDFVRENGGPDREASGVAIVEYDAIWPPRFGEPLALDGVRDLLKDHPVHVFDSKTWSFVPLSEVWRVDGDPSEPLQASFGGELGLQDAEVVTSPGEVGVDLRWRMLSQPRPLVVFVHIYDAGGALVAQHDAPLGQNGAPFLYAPFELRRENDVILDRHVIQLPAGLAGGEYRVATGVYDAATQQRLNARTVDGEPIPDNAAVLARLPLP